MTEPDIAGDYDERDAAAVYSVLIELGQVLGAYRDRFVIVGGAVPWLLLPDAKPPHVGTLDIDLNLDPDALSDGEYAFLIETLEKADYQRDIDGLKPFQLRRWVKPHTGGDPIPVIVDLLMPRDAKRKKNRPPLVSGLRVIEADGGGVALQHHVTKHLEGTMPDGRHNRVDLLVASIPALLVMKGYALDGRDKKKDAYDIYFTVRHYPGGPEVLAMDCKELLSDSVALAGYQKIARKFSRDDDFGPQTVRMFLAESDLLDGMTPDQVQMDAYRQVRA